MPSLRCKRSLDKEMAATQETQRRSPRKQSTKRKPEDDQLQENMGTPSKRLRSSSRASNDSPAKTPTRRSVRHSPEKRLPAKSFYGNTKYVGPLERRAQRETNNGHLKSIDTNVSPVPIKKEKPGTRKRNASKKGQNSNKKAPSPKESQVKGFASRYSKVRVSNSYRSPSVKDSPLLKSPTEDFNEVIDSQDQDSRSGTPDSNKPQKKFFKNRLSPGELREKASHKVPLRKGFQVAYQREKVKSTAEPQQTESVILSKSDKRKVSSSGLLASLSSIKKLKTNCSQENLSDSLSVESEVTSRAGSTVNGDDDYSRVTFEVLSSSKKSTIATSKHEDTESLLASICDELDAEDFDFEPAGGTSTDSACHSQTSPSVCSEQGAESSSLTAASADPACDDQSNVSNAKEETAGEKSQEGDTSSTNGAQADSVLLLSEMSSEQSPSELHTPKKSKQAKKLFSIFTRSSPRFKKSSSVNASPSSSVPCTPDSNRPSPGSRKRLTGVRMLPDRDGKEQMLLDFGQKLREPTQCDKCGMTYTEGEPSDEATHAKFHKTVVNSLKFSGWKKEKICQENVDGSRIIVATAEDKFATKKVDVIRQIVDNELGFVVERQKLTEGMKTFLYISEDKKIIGCCIAERITKGYRMLSDSQSEDSGHSIVDKTWCCSTKPTPAKCGISRIWVLASERRKQIATQLLECVRYNFLMGYPLKKTDLAFSDPTPAGRNFASKYTGSSHFMVYKHNIGESQ